MLYWNGAREPKATPLQLLDESELAEPDTGELIFVGQSGIVSYQSGSFTRLLSGEPNG